MSYQTTCILVVKILCRILVVLWGLITIWPAMMLSDSGTNSAIAIAYVMFSASIFFILSGIFAKWSLFAAAWFAIVIWLVPFPEKLHYFLLVTLVPLVMVVAFLFAFGWIGRRDPSTDASMLSPLDNITDMQVLNLVDNKSSSQYRDAPAMV